MERTGFHRIEPSRIFDLGCGTGEGSAELKQTFRKAEVISLDTSRAMLLQLRRKSRLRRALKPVCGDMGALPFATRSADLVFSNLACFWSPDPVGLFAEVRRILRPDGMFLFTTLGPAALVQLQDAFELVGDSMRAPFFPDLLEVGDALASVGFRETVMDTEKITLHYPSLDALAEELEATGTVLLIEGWERWESVKDQLELAFGPILVQGKYPLTFEIIYGTAFGPPEGQPQQTPDQDVVTISVDSLLKSRPIGYD